MAAQKAPAADYLFINGHIYTSNPARPWVEAVAVSGDKIAAVGTTAALSRYRGAATHVIDLGGRMAAPGFIDTHTHFLWGSYGLAGIQI
ncbi:MAG TPA: amidohydrolase, partial [Terriglobales bacterium]